MTRTRRRGLAMNPGHVLRTLTYKDTGVRVVLSDTDGASPAASDDYMIDQEFGDRKTPNPAYSERIKRVGGTFSGSYYIEDDLTISEGVANSYVMDRMASFPPFFPSPSFPLDGDLAMMALGKSSPGKPHVSLPVAIGELRELPRTMLSFLNAKNLDSLKNTYSGNGRYRKPPTLTPRNHRDYHRIMAGLDGGKRSRRTSRNSIAEYEFGLMPLVRDIVNLFSVPKFVDDRVDRIRANAGVLVEHRNVHDYSTSSSDGYTRNFNTAHGIWVNSIETYVYRESTRATVTWTPRRSLYGTSDQSMRDYAMSMALGLTPAHIAYSAYQLLPWSWLFDWFGNTGDMLASQTATLDYSAAVTLSSKRKVSLVYDHVDVPFWGSASKAVISREEWVRKPNVIPLWVPIRPSPPVLQAKQLLILLGIADNLRSARVG